MLVVSSIVVAMLVSALIALVRTMQPQSVVVAGESLPIAPTFGSFPSAVRLHQTLTDRISSATAVYVLGGRHLSIPADSADALVRPLRCRSLPAIAGFVAGLPLDARSFYEAYAASLGEQEPAASPEDYTLIVVGPRGTELAVTCLAQVRRSEVVVNDGGPASARYAVRQVMLWDAEAGAQRYAFAERTTSPGGPFIGAVHTWIRYQLNGAKEEGPACVVFPDPWVFAGTVGRPDDIPAFSRFSYFLAVSP